MNVRYPRVEEAIEALDESEQFNLELVRAHDGAMNGRVERGSVASGREDANTFHTIG